MSDWFIVTIGLVWIGVIAFFVFMWQGEIKDHDKTKKQQVRIAALALKIDDYIKEPPAQAVEQYDHEWLCRRGNELADNMDKIECPEKHLTRQPPGSSL